MLSEFGIVNDEALNTIKRSYFLGFFAKVFRHPNFIEEYTSFPNLC